MAYTLSLTNGTTLTIVTDGVVDSDTTSISLIGKNVSNFGDAQNENFLHMLENFSNSSQPSNSLKGQLWFNANEAVLRPAVYDGINWRPLAVLLYSNTTTDTLINGAGKDWSANRPGDLWFDSVKKQLHVITSNTGTGPVTSLIGPELVDGFATSKFESVKMFDTVGNTYPVMHMTLNGEVIGTISAATFTPGSTSTVAGFSRIYRGITFKNYNSSTLYTTSTSDVQLHGLHEQLDPTFVRRNVDEHIQSNWYIDNGQVLNFGTTAQSSISWNTATSRLLLASSGGIRLQSATTSVTFDGSSITPSNNTVDLGSTSTRYNVVYANISDATSIIANALTATTIVSDTIAVDNASVANTLTASIIRSDEVYDNGARVLTTTTVGTFSTEFIKGTENQIAVTPATGTVTLSLPNIVEVRQLRGAGINNTGTISGIWTLATGASLQATYADLAECYQADKEYESGAVLEFGGEYEVTVAEDSTRRVAGVVSTNPAYLMNRQLMGANVAVVALTGRVPCKVRGQVRKGDMMVAAGNGFARAENSPVLGSVIGKALENFDGVEGVIEVVVGRL